MAEPFPKSIEMRLPKAWIGLSLGAWLVLACLSGGGLVATATGASAQQSVTPPAGQPRITAPGSRRGRMHRRHRRHHR